MLAEHFFKLEPDKQEKIIAACLKEFASYPYSLASTNRIVELARISKGVIFKYFGSKELLYLFLAQKVAEDIMAFYQKELERMPDDFFESLLWLNKKEMEFFHFRPLHEGFLQQLQQSAGSPVYQKAMELYRSFSKPVYDLVFTKFNRSLFRDDIEASRIMQFTFWIIEGIKKQFRNTPAPFDRIEEELRVYFSLIQLGILKPEE